MSIPSGLAHELSRALQISEADGIKHSIRTIKCWFFTRVNAEKTNIAYFKIKKLEPSLTKLSGIEMQHQ